MRSPMTKCVTAFAARRIRAYAETDAPGMVDVLRGQAQALRNPPRTFDALVRGLAKTIPESARCVADHAGVPPKGI